MNKPGGTRWEVDTMVYGIPSHPFVTKQQVFFIVLINFEYTFKLIAERSIRVF